MRLSGDDARARVTRHDHGILCTVHPVRGVDAVPVAYVVVDDHIGIPIDLVKPKSAMRLQRERNLDVDPRAALLVEHWDPVDWSRLWWVRTELRWCGADADPDVAPLATALAEQLAERYPQYRDRPFARVLVLRVLAMTGWTASR